MKIVFFILAILIFSYNYDRTCASRETSKLKSPINLKKTLSNNLAKNNPNIKISSKLNKITESKVNSWQNNIILVANSAVTICSMILSRAVLKINFSNKEIIKMARIVFVFYLVFCQMYYLLLNYLIRIRNEASKVEIKSPFDAILGSMQFGSALNFGLPINGKNIMTSKDYDLKENKKLFSNLLFESLGVFYMHFVKKNNSPLLLVPILGISNRIKSPLFFIHYLRFRPIGQLKRPFKSIFENLFKNIEVFEEDDDRKNEAIDNESVELKTQLENLNQAKYSSKQRHKSPSKFKKTHSSLSKNIEKDGNKNQIVDSEIQSDFKNTHLNEKVLSDKKMINDKQNIDEALKKFDEIFS